MKLRLPSEFLYQLFALLIAVIVVHAAYVGVIRPSADAQLATQAAQQAAGEDPYRQSIDCDRDQGFRTGSLLYSHALGTCHHGL
jgi:hypothetical protein